MAPEDDLLAGHDAAGVGLRVADGFVHRPCSPRVARTRDGGYGSRSPVACLELDRLAEPPLIRRAIRSCAHQLLSQPESLRRCYRRDFLRHSDITEGHPGVDRNESRAGHGLALGYPSQSVLPVRAPPRGLSPGDQLGLGARGRREAFPPRPGRRAVKLVRVLSRLAVLSLAAAALAGLTGIYGGSTRSPLPNPQWQMGRQHRPSAPRVSQFPEFIGEGMLVALFAVVGRIGLRLRLSPVPRSEGQPILLNLRRGSQDR
jgi:hypothetical protein